MIGLGLIPIFITGNLSSKIIIVRGLEDVVNNLISTDLSNLALIHEFAPPKYLEKPNLSIRIEFMQLKIERLSTKR